ncbi:hypothetical protein FP803_05150 [Candidatus Woesearchaeota archaeon]|nr:hypothetical protein [Candidatus Woesearchaeota archaeon]
MIKLNFGFLIALLLLSPLVSAFGVTAPYWDGNPLIMYPGQTKDFALILQNMVGNEDMVLKAELVSGAEIAALVDEKLEYLVPLGRKDIEVNLRVEIPEDAPLDKEYTIGVSFKQILEDEGKMVQMAGEVGKNIPVIVKSESEVLPEEEETPTPEEERGFPTAMVVLLLVIIVILGYVILKKKK